MAEFICGSCGNTLAVAAAYLTDATDQSVRTFRLTVMDTTLFLTFALGAVVYNEWLQVRIGIFNHLFVLLFICLLVYSFVCLLLSESFVSALVCRQIGLLTKLLTINKICQNLSTFTETERTKAFEILTEL